MRQRSVSIGQKTIITSKNLPKAPSKRFLYLFKLWEINKMWANFLVDVSRGFGCTPWNGIISDLNTKIKINLQLKSYQINTIKVSMDPNWLKPNVFVVQNGKLVPRANTPVQKKNYRYIHYDPLNNPAPDDYFRETISRLQKENNTLKNQLARILEDASSRTNLSAQGNQKDLIRSLQAQVAALKEELSRKQQEIQDKNQQLTQKDKKILEIGNQNTRLHLRINSVIKQIETLNKVMSKKDEEIMVKKEQIEEYCRTLEKLTLKDKEEQRTMFSENHLTTPKIEEKGEEEQDSFFSVDYNSNYDGNSVDKRYMTPRVDNFRVDDRIQYLNRTQEQKPINQFYFNNQRQHEIYADHDNKSGTGKQILHNFKNSLWSGQVKKLDSLQTKDSSLKSSVDHIRK